MSRLRENVKHIFDCFYDVSIPSNFGDRLDASAIRLKFPTSFEEKFLSEVPTLASPCAVESKAVEHFSFVLTKDQRWLYGFCRRSPTDCSSLVLLSALPWHDLMYTLLDTLHLVLADGGDRELEQCLAAAYNTPVPADGDTLHFTLPDGKEFSASCPDRRRLPSVLQDRTLTEYWSVVNDETKLEVFAALLHERHLLVTSSRLGRLSVCVQAAQSLLYPLWWQHIYQPVVAAAHRGCLSSPVPFLAGCPLSVVERLRPADLADGCVRLDADQSRLVSPHGDLKKLPEDLVTNLRRQLKQAGPGDGVARAFQTAVFQLLGGYRNGIRRRADGEPDFDHDAFLQSQPPKRRPFLRTLLKTQMFQEFIDERLSQPDAPDDALLRQPSEPPFAATLAGRRTLKKRRLFSIGSGGAGEPRAERLGSMSVRISSVPDEYHRWRSESVSSRSAPSSPTSQRLNGAGQSAPSLVHLGRSQPGTVPAGGHHRSAGQAPVQDGSLDDPLAGFPLTDGGSSLMDEINAELSKLGQMPVLGDAGDSDDVFTGGASGGPAPRAANGRLA